MVGVGGEVTVVTIGVEEFKFSSFASLPRHELAVGRGGRDGDASRASCRVVAVTRATHGGDSMAGVWRCVTVNAPRDVTHFCVKSRKFLDFSLGVADSGLEDL